MPVDGDTGCRLPVPHRQAGSGTATAVHSAAGPVVALAVVPAFAGLTADSFVCLADLAGPVPGPLYSVRPATGWGSFYLLADSFTYLFDCSPNSNRVLHSSGVRRYSATECSEIARKYNGKREQLWLVDYIRN